MSILESARIPLLVNRLLKRDAKIEWRNERLMLVYIALVSSGTLFLWGIPLIQLLDSFGVVFVPLFAVAFILMPIAFGLFAATLTVRDVHDEAADLLKLSNVSTSELLLSYVLATLYRLRTVLRVAAGLVPILAVLVGFGLMLARQFDSECIVSPLGFQYCSSTNGYLGGTSLAALIIAIGQLMVACFGVTINVIGTAVLATVIGVGAAYLWKSQTAAIASTFALALLIGLFTVFVTIPELTYGAVLNVSLLHIVPALVYTAWFALMPYLGSKALSYVIQRRMGRPA